MAYKCFAGREVSVSVLGTALLSSILVPLCVHRTHCGPGTRCPSNLRQLYQLGVVHAASHHGKWPEGTGSALWRSLAEMKPPLIDPDHLEILACPFKGEDEAGRWDYLGPRKPVSELGPLDPLAGDRPGNHGPGQPGYLLLKDGSVVEAPEGDPRWAVLGN